AGSPIGALTVSASGTGTISYQWYSNTSASTTGGTLINGATSSSYTPTDTTAGTYYYYVVASSDCSTASSSVATVVVNALPMVYAGPNKTITCKNETVILNGSVTPNENQINYSYLWTTQNGVIDSGATTLTPTVSESGLYTLKVTNSLTGCSSSSTVSVRKNITQPTAVIIASDTELTCDLTTITLNAITSVVQGEASYLWSKDNQWMSGITTPSIEVTEPGEYLVVVTDSDNGCYDAEKITITQSINNPIISITGNETLTCTITSVVLDASGSTVQGDASYLWSTGATTSSIEVTAAGEYTVTVTDSINGCSSTETVMVSEDTTAVVASITGNETLTCTTTSVVLDASGSTVQGDASYLWSTGATTSSIEVTAAGEYTVTVTDSINGCSSTETVMVSEDTTAVVASITGNETLTCTTTSV
ncbi:hypothetical protein, partial [uncultured Lutibacter sp.]|uniref:hypothetical protein n=1 Tax=uncultured Lutibacter sp. TaxID=437739 RepID=UPI00261DCE96